MSLGNVLLLFRMAIELDRARGAEILRAALSAPVSDVDDHSTQLRPRLVALALATATTAAGTA